MNRILKILFLGLFIKPIVLLGLGLNVFFKFRLPQTGPAIIVANHNSHLDTMVLMSLYPLSQIHRVRPVAAADYFLANRYIAWFSLNVIGIIPITRSQITDKTVLFDKCYQALDNGDILLIFPEGSRGAPEQLSALKKGIYHLVKARPDVNVVPVMLHGLGRALPKGEAILVPFNCDVVIGESLPFIEDSPRYIASISDALNTLLALCLTRQAVVEDDE
ncbi:lysophospholipid acyltransferase family protein [Cobetia sp. QF-1]|uniref:lysophospholipid acyltransferase family protein n=1 Tax=Cobetia sp. QF-1 TaxID=1969833 RepID=UPI000B548233|nr:lysophospholipid acyltransferase family protein [Cobetia sp. QF-1]